MRLFWFRFLVLPPKANKPVASKVPTVTPIAVAPTPVATVVGLSSVYSSAPFPMFDILLVYFCIVDSDCSGCKISSSDTCEGKV